MGQESNTLELKKDEQLTLELRALYERYGYRKYRMSRFEEYELYSENKSFLSDPQVITFNDMNGKLLALKPDVTLSIGKNARGDGRGRERLYYIENVYRFSKQARGYQEISQMGVELLGDMDLYAMAEVLGLAVRSLEAADANYVTEISHMGFIGGLMDSLSIEKKGRDALLARLKTKNRHELMDVAAELGISEFYREKLLRLAEIEGTVPQALQKARTIVVNDAMDNALTELEGLYRVMEAEGLTDRLQADFSIVNDISYYSGLIFQGFVERIPQPVLAGGRYDNLMSRFGKKAGAIGFALYLDQLNRYYPNQPRYDVDALILYSRETPPEALAAAVKAMTDRGEKVFVDVTEPAELRYRKRCFFEDGAMKEEENNA
ncbi:MAG: ATP phosphoribosyltransferase regulatory subunit [Bacillota bacterium]|nr:ATP phosphoribosyltransferase regulatory subunit [Bacillota bacterium]